MTVAYYLYMMSSCNKKSIMSCLENGVKTIEHGFMFDGDAAALMKKGVYMTTSMQAFAPELDKVGAIAASPVSSGLRRLQHWRRSKTTLRTRENTDRNLGTRTTSSARTSRSTGSS
jgi:hypothetical protein